jgi:hypothetical protein
MFLIFLLLFGSSQKEGVRLPNKTVQSKKHWSFRPTKAQNRRSPQKKDRVPTCVGPNIHGGAEAPRAGRLDVLDLFASFWIKPKRRRTAPKQNRSVKKVPVTTPTNKSKEPTLFPKNRPPPKTNHSFAQEKMPSNSYPV